MRVYRYCRRKRPVVLAHPFHEKAAASQLSTVPCVNPRKENSCSQAHTRHCSHLRVPSFDAARPCRSVQDKGGHQQEPQAQAYTRGSISSSFRHFTPLTLVAARGLGASVCGAYRLQQRLALEWLAVDQHPRRTLVGGDEGGRLLRVCGVDCEGLGWIGDASCDSRRVDSSLRGALSQHLGWVSRISTRRVGRLLVTRHEPANIPSLCRPQAKTGTGRIQTYGQ
jgi:hypothetical protein